MFAILQLFPYLTIYCRGIAFKTPDFYPTHLGNIIFPSPFLYWSIPNSMENIPILLFVGIVPIIKSSFPVCTDELVPVITLSHYIQNV